MFTKQSVLETLFVGAAQASSCVKRIVICRHRRRHYRYYVNTIIITTLFGVQPFGHLGTATTRNVYRDTDSFFFCHVASHYQ